MIQTICYTIFDGVWPRTKTSRTDVDWTELVQRIRDAPTYIDKAHCPLISLCEYGDTIDAAHKCLRYAGNVQRVWGVEVDYDGETISPELASERLQQANLQAVVYTSPSHKPSKPRWRALLPFSEPALPEKRAEYLGRANRALGGIATRESFTLSQSFYIGRVKGADYDVHTTEGRCVDMASDLDPLYYEGYSHNGNGQGIRDATTDAELRGAFERGEDRYQAMLKLSSRWAARGMATDDIEAALLKMLGTDTVNSEGIDLRSRVRPMAESAVRKYGESRPEKRKKEESQPKSLKDLKRHSVAQIVRGEPAAVDWLIEEILPCGCFLIVGRPKVGKSWLLLQIGAALDQGTDLLGFKARGQFETLYAAAEDDPGRIASRFSKYQVRELPEKLTFWCRDDIKQYAAQFSETYTLAEFIDLFLAENQTIRALFLDTESTLRAAWDGGTMRRDVSVTRNDYAEVREFDEIAHRRKVFIGLVNHTSKRRNGTWVDIHELINRTNTALAGASGSWVLADPPSADPLSKTEKFKVLGIRGRDLTKDYMLAVEQDEFGVFKSLGPYEEVRKSQCEQEILEALLEISKAGLARNENGWVPSKQLAEWCDKRSGNVQQCLTRMINSGRPRWGTFTLQARRKLGFKLSIPGNKAPEDDL